MVIELAFLTNVFLKYKSGLVMVLALITVEPFNVNTTR